MPTNVTALRVTTDWSNPALDLYLYAYAPNGQLIGSSYCFQRKLVWYVFPIQSEALASTSQITTEIDLIVRC